jgi:arginyl-tRNA synthetase
LHTYHGRMSFKGQKMSSRLGGVPLAQDILDVVSEEVQARASELTAKTTEHIALAALKFSILRTQAGKDINFDPDTSLSFEGDSGPYLQYTAVRAQSVLDKAAQLQLMPIIDMERDAIELERLLIRFPEIVRNATEDWAPHQVVGYLVDIAQQFNSWYGNTKIIDVENPATPHHLAITQAVVHTMKNGLSLLGIETPEKM